jgi:hypothetical protein
LRVLGALRRDPVDLVLRFLFRVPPELNGQTHAVAERTDFEMLPQIRPWPASPTHGVASIDHLEHASRERAAALGEAGFIAVLRPCAIVEQGGRARRA